MNIWIQANTMDQLLEIVYEYKKTLAFWYSKLCFVVFSTALFFVFEKSNTLKLQGVPREVKKPQQWQQRQRWMASGLIFFFSSFSLPLGPRLLVECQACRWELSLYWLSTSLGSPPPKPPKFPPAHLHTTSEPTSPPFWRQGPLKRPPAYKVNGHQAFMGKC